MARSDAVGKEPTIDEINAQEVSRFKGFSTTDGEVSDGTATPEEQRALAARDAQELASRRALNGGAPLLNAEGEGDAENDDKTGTEGEEGEQETPEEKKAREAREAKMTDKQKAAAALQAKVGGKDGQKHRSANERIGQAVAKQRAAERALEDYRVEAARAMGALEARLAALEGRPLTPTSKDGKPPVDKDAPRATDYEYGELDAGYIRDLAVYETRKAIAAEQTKQTAASQTEAQRREAQEFKAKAEKFEASGTDLYDDFTDVVVQGAKDGTWPLTKTFGDLMFDSDSGPHIAYYLATHVKEAQRIMGLSPSAQAAAFGRLEAAFSSTSSDATQPENGQQQQDKPGQGTPAKQAQAAPGSTTKAPPPLKHQARGNGGKTQVGADTTDFAAFERLAMAANT